MGFWRKLFGVDSKLTPAFADEDYGTLRDSRVQAAIKVASNLYLRTIPGGEDAPAPLQFSLPDSRYRYLIFCLSTVVSAVLAYDEAKEIKHPEVLMKGCLLFATWIATENPQDYFGGQASPQDSVRSTSSYFNEFLKDWSRWPELEKAGRYTETIELICSMIHTTESNEPAGQSDKQRLGELGLYISCQLATMRGAFVELVTGEADD